MKRYILESTQMTMVRKQDLQVDFTLILAMHSGLS